MYLFDSLGELESPNLPPIETLKKALEESKCFNDQKYKCIKPI